jgi:hypothetical protein
VTRRQILLLLTLAGCGGSRSGAPGDASPAAEPTPVEALAVYAPRRVMVLPTQGVRSGDPMGWIAPGTTQRGMLAQVDSALELEFRARGLTPAWILASDMSRTASRNPVHVVSPADIRAGDAVRQLERRRNEDIPEPVASQLRVHAGFTDARWALVPSELWFERGEFADAGRAVLRVGILDIRGSKLVFIGDITGTDAGDAATAILNLGRRFAGLITPR